MDKEFIGKLRNIHFTEKTRRIENEYGHEKEKKHADGVYIR